MASVLGRRHLEGDGAIWKIFVLVSLGLDLTQLLTLDTDATCLSANVKSVLPGTTSPFSFQFYCGTLQNGSHVIFKVMVSCCFDISYQRHTVHLIVLFTQRQQLHNKTEFSLLLVRFVCSMNSILIVASATRLLLCFHFF